jgi:hypothetical protein
MIKKTEGRNEFSQNKIPKKWIDSRIQLNLMVYIMEERHVYVILDID